MKATPHESAVGHVSGRARYSDELHPLEGMLSAWPVQATHAHARIAAIDATAARAAPGVRAVLTADDVPGENDTGPIVHDEPLLPSQTVEYFGQALAWVIAETEAQARAAAALVRVRLEPLEAAITLDQAIARERRIGAPMTIQRGDIDAALARAPHVIEATFEIGGQDHFYLETHASTAWIDSEGLVQVVSSTQHPSETQIIIARVLGLPLARVVVRCVRMGGGFGGKETQANPFAAIAALAAFKLGAAVRIKLDRQLDMQLTGKRHPFRARYRVGFDRDGVIDAFDVALDADGGFSCDLSPPVLMRAMVHVDNAYFIPNLRVRGQIWRTHTPSNTAFRGFGGPQGMLVGEDAIARVAQQLSADPAQIRARHFYAEPDRNDTHYGQPVVDNHLRALWDELLVSSAYAARRSALHAANLVDRERVRGIAITPVKFGISFNKTEYNQAGALVHLYTDGSVQLNHGGTEMGQGLHSKMIAVAARVLGVDSSRIQIMQTATDKVPNTSATAASSGSDLNGQAVRAACETLLERLREPASALLDCAPEQVRFADDQALGPNRRIGFTDVVRAAYAARISLSATGFYRTPDIHWNPQTGRGHPFYYFAFGAAVAEVEVERDTGVSRLVRVDLLHDVGESLNRLIDLGQIEGGFVQGLGWLTSEQLVTDPDGRLKTDAPSTYKIPTVGEVPVDFRVALFKRRQPFSTQTIFHSKGVGEPPLMLALSVREALRDAIAQARPGAVELATPATPEAVWRALRGI